MPIVKVAQPPAYGIPGMEYRILLNSCAVTGVPAQPQILSCTARFYLWIDLYSAHFADDVKQLQFS